MKSRNRLLSTLLLCLPLVWVGMLWNHLPTRILMHEGDDNQPNRYVLRQEWLSMLLSVMFSLVLVRSGVLALLRRYLGSQDDSRFIRIYLLSAAFVSSNLGLFILKTIYQSSDYLPVVMALFGAAGVYLTVATDLPVTNQLAKPIRTPQRKEALRQLHTLSRLVIIRVNLLAALLMFLVRSEDRWTIGMAANLLVFAALSIMTFIWRSSG